MLAEPGPLEVTEQLLPPPIKLQLTQLRQYRPTPDLVALHCESPVETRREPTPGLTLVVAERPIAQSLEQVFAPVQPKPIVQLRVEPVQPAASGIAGPAQVTEKTAPRPLPLLLEASDRPPL